MSKHSKNFLVSFSPTWQTCPTLLRNEGHHISYYFLLRLWEGGESNKSIILSLLSFLCLCRLYPASVTSLPPYSYQYRGDQMNSESSRGTQKHPSEQCWTFLNFINFFGQKLKKNSFWTLSPTKPDLFGRRDYLGLEHCTLVLLVLQSK